MNLALPEKMSRLQKGLVLFTLIMLLFTLARAGLYFSYPGLFSNLSPGLVLQAFANGLRFDASVVIRLVAIPLLLMWLPLRILDRRVWVDGFAWLIYLITLGLLLLLIGDIVYFDNVKRHVSYELMQMKNDIGFLVQFAIQSQLPALVGFALFAVALGWVWLQLLRIPMKPTRYAAGKFVGLFLLLFIAGRGGIDGKLLDVVDAYGTGDAEYGHLSLNGAFSTVAFAMTMEDVDHHFFDYEEAVNIVNGDTGSVDAEFPMVKQYSADATGYNVVFVLLESWNFDYVDSYSGSSYGVTPNFDALANDGMRFTRFYAAGQRSIEGIQATLIGVPALKGLPHLDEGIAVSNVSRLGSLARGNGYNTLFVQASGRGSLKIDGIAAATGFEEFYGQEDVPLLYDYPDSDAAAFGWDYDTLQFMKGRIDRFNKPFLAYAFTGTTHQPYAELPEQFMKHLPHEPSGESGYLNTLLYSDWSLGQFMAEAKKSPWFDKTVFIFSADHVNKFQQGQDVPSRFHIPFLIYAPGIIEARENRVIGSQLDVLPTIVDLLGFDDEFAALGHSLLRKKGEGEAFVSFGAQHIGLIDGSGYIRHDLNRLLESHAEMESSIPALEERLLAMDQLSYELLRSNRWAR